MVINIKKPVTAEKIKKAFSMLAKSQKRNKGFDAKKHSGKLKGVFGDALQYQKSVRDEWE